MSKNPMNFMVEKTQIAESRARELNEQVQCLIKETEECRGELKLLKARLDKEIESQVELMRETDFISDCAGNMCNGCSMKATESCSNCPIRPAADKYGLWEK